MLTGRVPFEGESAVTIALKQVSEQPVPPSQLNPAVSPALEAVVMRALAKDPAQRYPDADAFIAALQGEEVAADAARRRSRRRAPPPTSRPSRWPSRSRRSRSEPSRWWWWLLAVLAVAALIVGAVLLLNGGKKVSVPDVVGASQAAAEKALRDKGFSTDSTSRRRPQAAGPGHRPGPVGRDAGQEGLDRAPHGLRRARAGGRARRRRARRATPRPRS